MDLKSFKGVSPTTYAGMTLITGEQVLVTPKGVPVATAFIPEKIKKPEPISPDIRSFGVLNERVELVGDQLVLVNS